MTSDRDVIKGQRTLRRPRTSQRLTPADGSLPVAPTAAFTGQNTHGSRLDEAISRPSAPPPWRRAVSYRLVARRAQ